ncbi:MBL fold metallo-hydrolase [Patescibacteria group bacterium]|nr:MBL fold metallo-hydrolase [Patescibacteria group bacterium]MBU1472467.1 MBL fold metallo-hydrolase [Patescibacteria group bacterium]MBU2460281.1 MBL fold metallo-hydrolase [Patescibacteria group bacterium]MBU2544608.1 MBL fold metallo-hydrolase [Patescibacteria group bacterium]
MDILPLGHSSFRIRGKSATVVTDPYDKLVVGLTFPKVEADIVTVSHDHADHNHVSAVGGSPFVITGPGEYEIKGVSIIGISVLHDDEGGQKRGKNIIYRMEVDGIRIVHLGDLGHVLTTDQVDALDGVDVLFVPVGGEYTIDAVGAKAVVGDIDPAIVIPMHYHIEKLNKQTFGSLAPVSKFLSEMGKESLSQSKLIVHKDKLPTELQVVVLE